MDGPVTIDPPAWPKKVVGDTIKQLMKRHGISRETINDCKHEFLEMEQRIAAETADYVPEPNAHIQQDDE